MIRKIKIILIAALAFNYAANAQNQKIIGIYKIKSVMLNNNLLLTKANKDSIIKVKINATLELDRKSMNITLTKEDSLETIDFTKEFIKC